jgi:hypothetical protein
MVPPGIKAVDNQSVVIRAFGGAGGGYYPEEKRSFGVGSGDWAGGCAGGFAEFDGFEYLPSGEARSALDPPLQEGDVLEIWVGCAGKSTTSAIDGVGEGEGGGGSSAVRLVARTLGGAKPIPVKGGPILLAVAGGGGGAGSDGFGSVAGGFGGKSGVAGGFSGDTFQKGNGNGGGGGVNGAGGVGGASTSCPGQAGQSFSVDPDDHEGGGGGDRLSPQPDVTWGYNLGGQGSAGMALHQGGGSGTGYGCAGDFAGGGGGGGGSYSLSMNPFTAAGDTLGEPTRLPVTSVGSSGDGYVVIEWTPDVLGGRDCYYNCRAVWMNSKPTLPGTNLPIVKQQFHLPRGVQGVHAIVYGAPGGRGMGVAGDSVPELQINAGGLGGYAGAVGNGTDVLINNNFIVELGHPGGNGNEVVLPNDTSSEGFGPDRGHGGGGSSAIYIVPAGSDRNPVVDNSTLVLLAGGGGSGGDRYTNDDKPSFVNGEQEGASGVVVGVAGFDGGQLGAGKNAYPDSFPPLTPGANQGGTGGAGDNRTDPAYHRASANLRGGMASAGWRSRQWRAARE